MDTSHLAIIHAVFEACGMMLTALLALHAYNVRRARKQSARFEQLTIMLQEWLILKIEHDQVMKWWAAQQTPPRKLNDLETRNESGAFRTEQPKSEDL